MRRSEEKRLLQLLRTPPPGSKIEAAQRYGLDLTMNLRLLRMTAEQRVKDMEGAFRLVEEIRRAKNIDIS